MKRQLLLGLLLVFAPTVCIADAIPVGTAYMLSDLWGGTWSDVNKTTSNTEDDEMCWAAVASNVLEWTNYGKVGGMTTADEMFVYFQDHWTDKGGLISYAWHWWLEGIHHGYGSAYPDVPGGGFYPGVTYEDVSRMSSDHSTTTKTFDIIKEYSHDGFGIGLSVMKITGGTHALTCWGYQYDTDYRGVWVTDSDDNVEGLRYYEVRKHHPYSWNLAWTDWYLEDFYGADNWYITGVWGLASRPDPNALLGDANKDGLVDSVDASILSSHWMRNDAQWEMGDFDGDHRVNDADAAILAAHWGQTIGGDQGVPEPSATAILLAGFASLLAVAFWTEVKHDAR